MHRSRVQPEEDRDRSEHHQRETQEGSKTSEHHREHRTHLSEKEAKALEELDNFDAKLIDQNLQHAHEKSTRGSTRTKIIVLIAFVILALGLIFFTVFAFLFYKSGISCWGYAGKSLELHNQIRQLYQYTPNLTLDTKLTLRAIECAKYFVNTGPPFNYECPFKTNEGVNLWTHNSRINLEAAATMAVKDWFSEEWYSPSSPNPVTTGSPTSPEFRTNEHFSQVVWRSSVNLGVGVERTSGLTVVVCLYFPPGNLPGLMDINVFPPKDLNKTTI